MADNLSKLNLSTFKVYILSVHAFSGNQAHILGFTSAMLYFDQQDHFILFYYFLFILYFVYLFDCIVLYLILLFYLLEQNFYLYFILLHFI